MPRPSPRLAPVTRTAGVESIESIILNTARAPAMGRRRISWLSVLPLGRPAEPAVLSSAAIDILYIGQVAVDRVSSARSAGRREITAPLSATPRVDRPFSASPERGRRPLESPPERARYRRRPVDWESSATAYRPRRSPRPF